MVDSPVAKMLRSSIGEEISPDFNMPTYKRGTFSNRFTMGHPTGDPFGHHVERYDGQRTWKCLPEIDFMPLKGWGSLAP